MKNPPPGKEWMGLTKSQMMQGAKAYKFKKSAGASASAGRFGTDEPKPKRRTMEYTIPKGAAKPKAAKPSLGGAKGVPKRVRPRGGSANISQMPKIYKRGK